MADINKKSHGWGLETNMKIVMFIMAGSVALFVTLLIVAWFFTDLPKFH